MNKKYILGIDEGTTSVRTVLFNTDTNEIENIEKVKFYEPFNSYQHILYKINKEELECMITNMKST